MSTKTLIEWTDRTWNPVRGCSLCSSGCTNCYAMRQAHRFSGPGQPYKGLTRMTAHGPVWTGKIRLVEEALEEPLHWRIPQRIFVNSMSDLFHEDVPEEFIDRVFAAMALASHHTFQILTKRAKRMSDYMRRFSGVGLGLFETPIIDTPEWLDAEGLITAMRESSENWSPAEEHRAVRLEAAMESNYQLPLRNVHLGVSIEDVDALVRMAHLRNTPAAVRFLSLEPLLEDLGRLNLEFLHPKERIHWVIVGGESGPHARRCDIDWIRGITRQCKRAGVPVFVKQLGARPFADRAGGDPAEWPEDLRVREFPTEVSR